MKSVFLHLQQNPEVLILEVGVKVFTVALRVPEAIAVEVVVIMGIPDAVLPMVTRIEVTGHGHSQKSNLFCCGANGRWCVRFG